MNEPLTGKVALVTGGSRGLGAATVRLLAEQGADVGFTYVNSEKLAQAVVDEVRATGAKVAAFRSDQADPSGAPALIDAVVAQFGGLDILVNNAAINRGDNFATTTDRAWDAVIDTNVNSLFAVTKPIYKQMIRQRKGSILNITSIGAIRALPTAVHYATSKAAVIGFTKCLSREAATFGVTVNAIAAGIFDTELAHELPDRLIQMHQFWAAAGRMGRPAELAEIAAFLVSERNSFMNGEIIIVDGGAVT
jgi:3-oxoacyl-[acyl-carrier protein] reductase